MALALVVQEEEKEYHHSKTYDPAYELLEEDEEEEYYYNPNYNKVSCGFFNFKRSCVRVMRLVRPNNRNWCSNR